MLHRKYHGVCKDYHDDELTSHWEPPLFPFSPKAGLLIGLPTNFCLALGPCEKSQANWEKGDWEPETFTLLLHLSGQDQFQSPS